MFGVIGMDRVRQWGEGGGVSLIYPLKVEEATTSTMDWHFRHSRYRFASAMSSIVNKVSNNEDWQSLWCKGSELRGKVGGVLLGSKGLTMATLRVFFPNRFQLTSNSDVFPPPSLRLVVVVVAAERLYFITAYRSSCLHENGSIEEHSGLEVCLGIWGQWTKTEQK